MTSIKIVTFRDVSQPWSFCSESASFAKKGKALVGNMENCLRHQDCIHKDCTVLKANAKTVPTDASAGGVLTLLG